MPDPAAPAPQIGWMSALSLRHLRMPSALALIAANLVPLYGVMFWGWDLFGLMVLYWLETGIVGFFAILQMAMAARGRALFLVPFFILHFGGFMTGHMVFLALMFGQGQVGGFTDIPGAVWRMMWGQGLWLAVVALFLSHLVSFLINVLRPLLRWWRGERPATAHRAVQGDPQAVMLAPYGRIVVMHVTILIGGLLVEMFQTKLAAFVLLIALKTAVDVAAHVRKNFSPVAVTTT